MNFTAKFEFILSFIFASWFTLININDKNDEKTDGLLIVEIVPDDQNIKTIVLPEEGDKVHIWGAWVTDKPKGWHEIHPTWKITKE